MSRLTGGQLLVEVLAAQGISHVFSIIGGQMCSVYDAISRRPQMTLVTLRNEAAAPIMAAGYTAVTGTPSVSMCTVGAGVVYEVAGLMVPWYRYLPVISIAPQVQSWKMNPHQENLQGLDQHRIFEPITKWNAIVYHWDRIPQLTDRALREALANAPGPVHLDVPVDVLFQTKKPGAEFRKIKTLRGTTRYTGSLPGPADQVESGRAAIAAARRPLALVGQGIGRPGRYPEIRDLLNRLGLPVLMSDSSFGCMDGADNGHAGAAALFTGAEAGRPVIAEADLILTIGLDDEIKELLDGVAAAAVVQVEVDPGALLTGRADHVGVNADPVSFLAAVATPATPELLRWNERVRDVGNGIAGDMAGRMPGPAALFGRLAAEFNENDIVVVDGAELVDAARAFLRKARYHRLFVMDVRNLAGSGLAFALGAKIARPELPVTLVTDADSLYRHVQELQTASGLGLRISIVCAAEGLERSRVEAVLDGFGWRDMLV